MSRSLQPINQTLLSCVVFSTALIALAYRMLLGIDFTDESLYIATTYRFVLGDRPFIDELGFTQMASILLYPFFKLFYLGVGSTEGIVLFSRVLYLLFSIAVGVTIAVSVREILPRTLSFPLILLCSAFFPFSIPSLSYNTLGMGFFTVGLYLICTPYWTKAMPAPCLIFAGIAHSLAAFVYPTHTLSALCVTLLLALVLAENRTHTWCYVSGGIFGAVVVFALFWNTGFNELEQSYRFVLSWGKHQMGFSKWSNTLARILEMTPRWYIFAPAVALWCWTSRISSPLAVIGFIVVGMLCNYSGFAQHLTSMGLVIYLGLLTPVVLIAEPAGPFRKSAWFLWVSSLIGGSITAWSSGNSSAANAALGLFPAAVLTLICVARNQLRSTGSAEKNFLLSLSAVTLVLSQLIWNSYSSLYRESPHQLLTAQVSAGPFLGLHTTPSRARLITRLSKDLQPLASSSGNVLSFNRFPAGYLFTSMPPAVCSPWVVDEGRQFYQESFLGKLGSGTITIVNKQITGRPILYSTTDPLLAAVRDNQELRIDRPEYSIYFGLKANSGTPEPSQ